MKKVLLSVVIIIVISISLVLYINIKNKENNIVEETVEEVEEDFTEPAWMVEERKLYKESFIKEEDIYEIAKRNPDWDKIDIATDKKDILREQYPSGILGGIEYDDICIENGYEELTSPSVDIPDEFVLIVTKGLKKDKYTIYCTGILKNNFEIYIVEKKELYDDNGGRIKYPMDEEHWISNLQKIALKDDEEVGKSEDFYERYPNFTGILNPYNEETRNIEINEIVDQCNFEKKEYVCEVYYHHRYLYVTYKISFTVDDNNYIDTVNIEELSSREDEWNDKNKLFDSLDIFNKLLFKNRNREGLPFTNNYKKKLANLSNIINGYDIYEYRGINYKIGQPDKKILVKLYLTDRSVKYMGFKYIIMDNKIDDIIVTELPITEETFEDYTTEELYDMF